jgi:Protein of unknown function (DUF3040)
MSLNHRQLHRLRRIESGLLRSDPQLAAMLITFARLAAGELMPAWEQLATRRDRIRQAAALIVEAVTLLAAALVLLLDAIRGHRSPARSRPRPVQGWNPAQGS